MEMYPYSPEDQRLQTDADDKAVDRGFVAHLEISAAKAVAAATDGVHAAVIDNGVEQEIIANITNPGIPRNITATAGGTATDIGAIQVTIEGTNYNNEVITEILPIFTADTAGTVEGNKAFKTITKITIPAHDDVGATTAIGFGNKLGLPYKLARNTVLETYLDNIKESTPPTIVISATSIETNTIELNSSLSGNQVNAYLIV